MIQTLGVMKCIIAGALILMQMHATMARRRPSCPQSGSHCCAAIDKTVLPKPIEAVPERLPSAVFNSHTTRESEILRPEDICQLLPPSSIMPGRSHNMFPPNAIFFHEPITSVSDSSASTCAHGSPHSWCPSDSKATHWRSTSITLAFHGSCWPVPS